MVSGDSCTESARRTVRDPPPSPSTRNRRCLLHRIVAQNGAGATAATVGVGVSAPRVTLYGRAGCHLCEDARAVIDRVCRDVGEEYVEIDIDGDDELRARYGDEVPVTLVDGKQHDFWRVDEQRLRTALAHVD